MSTKKKLLISIGTVVIISLIVGVVWGLLSSKKESDFELTSSFYDGDFYSGGIGNSSEELNKNESHTLEPLLIE